MDIGFTEFVNAVKRSYKTKIHGSMKIEIPWKSLWNIPIILLMSIFSESNTSKCKNSLFIRSKEMKNIQQNFTKAFEICVYSGVIPT